MRIVTIVGARPQFIKASMLSRAFRDGKTGVQEVLVHTGQHYDSNMSDVFFDELDIPRPQYNLGIGGGTHGQNTGRMLEKLETICKDENPDFVLVYGDTDSTLAGALAAAKLHIPVAHVEAGLRSFNRKMPEEINRVVTDHVSTLLFAPTRLACENLKNEGVSDANISLVGDIMFDAAIFFKNRAVMPKWFERLDVEANRFILCTIHRAENTDDMSRMQGILSGLAGAECAVILPLHPRTRGKLAHMALSIPKNIHIVDPVGYLEMVWLEANCRIVATDSGGVQKEAYFHGKFCVTLREETEWVELVDHGFNKIVGSDATLISESIGSCVFPEVDPGLYGDGRTAYKINDVLAQF